MTNVSDLHQFRVRTPSFLITADYPAQVINLPNGVTMSKDKRDRKGLHHGEDSIYQ